MKLRNGFGHPNSLKVGLNAVANHIEILLLNAFHRLQCNISVSLLTAYLHKTDTLPDTEFLIRLQPTGSALQTLAGRDIIDDGHRTNLFFALRSRYPAALSIGRSGVGWCATMRTTWNASWRTVPGSTLEGVSRCQTRSRRPTYDIKRNHDRTAKFNRSCSSSSVGLQ